MCSAGVLTCSVLFNVKFLYMFTNDIINIKDTEFTEKLDIKIMLINYKYKRHRSCIKIFRFKNYIIKVLSYNYINGYMYFLRLRDAIWYIIINYILIK